MSLIVCGFYLDLALVIRVLTAFLFTCGILIAISRGWGKVGIALAKDPVGVAVPVLTCLAMIFTPQMSSMMIAAVGGYDKSGAYNENPLHQAWLVLGAALLGAQGWFWTRAAMNARAGRLHASMERVPAAEKWAIRIVFMAVFVISILPALPTMSILPGTHGTPNPLYKIYFDPTISEAWSRFRVHSPGKRGIKGGMISGLLVFLVWLGVFYRQKFKTASPVDGNLPTSRTGRLFRCAPGGWVSALIVFLFALAGMLITSIYPKVVDDNLHAASAALIAMSCLVPLATVLLAIYRDLAEWMLNLINPKCRGAMSRPADFLGVALLVGIPLMLSSVSMNVFKSYDVPNVRLVVVPKKDPQKKPDELPKKQDEPIVTLLSAAREETDEAADDFANHRARKPPIVVAVAGGASRSAAWTLSVLRMLDGVTHYEFSKNIFAFSSVSGGSLGVVTYAMARQRDPAHPDQIWNKTNVNGMVELARGDLLPAVIGQMFTIDLLTGVPQRGTALAKAFEAYWRGKNPDISKASEEFWKGKREEYWGEITPENQNTYFPTFTALRPYNKNLTYYNPHLILNGTDVDTGTRLLTSTIRFIDGVFPAAVDVLHGGSTELGYDVSPAMAVLNSARFPIISPSGRFKTNDEITRQVVDGGVFDASGIRTAMDLTAHLSDKYPRLFFEKTSPIIVMITNDGLSGTVDKATPCSTGTPADKLNLQSWRNISSQSSGGGGSSDLLTSLVGFVATRGAHQLVDRTLLARKSCYHGESVNDEKDNGDNLFVFDLPDPKPTSKFEAVPMNWVLNAGNCEFILNDARLSDANIDQAWKLALRLAIHITRSEVKTALEKLAQEDGHLCQPPGSNIAETSQTQPAPPISR